LRQRAQEQLAALAEANHRAAAVTPAGGVAQDGIPS
jgi:hypothetical protein